MINAEVPAAFLPPTLSPSAAELSRTGGGMRAANPLVGLPPAPICGLRHLAAVSWWKLQRKDFGRISATMSWLVFAFSGPVLWAISTHLDKYLVERYFKHSDVAVLLLFTAFIGVLTLPFIAYFEPGLVRHRRPAASRSLSFPASSIWVRCCFICARCNPRKPPWWRRSSRPCRCSVTSWLISFSARRCRPGKWPAAH